MATPNKYPVELKQRAVRMVRDLQRSEGSGHGEITRVARQLGINPESLRNWVRKDDEGTRPSGEIVPESDSAKDARIAELERKLAESQRANEILKAASAFFAKELDPSTAAMTAFVDTYRE